MIEIINGNLLDAKEDIICQQVNCQGVMGSGLAKQIREKYPEVYFCYKNFCDKYENFLLGECQIIPIYKNGEIIKIIANIFGQDNYGKDGKQYTDYDALRKGFKKLGFYSFAFHDAFYKSTIAIPYNIGCSLGGGDWNIVYQMINEIFDSHEDKVKIYKL